MVSNHKMLNSSEIIKRKDLFEEAVISNLTVVLFGIVINCINSLLLYTYFKNAVLAQEPRYILYMHLIINDMILLSVSVLLYVMSYALLYLNVAFCSIVLVFGSIVFKNTPLNLAGMAIERYVAVCYPLHHARICTIYHTKLLISIIWIMGSLPATMDLIVLLALRPLSFFTSDRLCIPQYVLNLEYNILSNAVINIGYMCLVWVLLFYTYFRVLFSAKAAASEPAQAQKAKRTILLHGVQLLLCTFSLTTQFINSTLGALFPYYQRVIFFCTFILTCILPRLLSPLIYGLRDQRFKKYMKTSLMCEAARRDIDPTNYQNSF